LKSKTEYEVLKELIRKWNEVLQVCPVNETDRIYIRNLIKNSEIKLEEIKSKSPEAFI